MKKSLTVSCVIVGYSVRIRQKSGAYHALCEGMRASCTRTPEEAVMKASIKAFNRCGLFGRTIVEEDVEIDKVCDGQYIARATAAEKRAA